jgi:hypothetical protein
MAMISIIIMTTDMTTVMVTVTATATDMGTDPQGRSPAFDC